MAQDSRTAEAAALNATLDTLVTDVDAYLAAGEGDNAAARDAVWSAVARRLRPVLGATRVPLAGSDDDGTVPDGVNVEPGAVPGGVDV